MGLVVGVTVRGAGVGVTVRGAGVAADPVLRGVGEGLRGAGVGVGGERLLAAAPPTAAAKTAEAVLLSVLPGGLVFLRCSSGVLRSRRSIPLVRGVTGSDDDCVFSVGCWRLRSFSSTVTSPQLVLALSLFKGRVNLSPLTGRRGGQQCE